MIIQLTCRAQNMQNFNSSSAFDIKIKIVLASFHHQTFFSKRAIDRSKLCRQVSIFFLLFVNIFSRRCASKCCTRWASSPKRCVPPTFYVWPPFSCETKLVYSTTLSLSFVESWTFLHNPFSKTQIFGNETKRIEIGVFSTMIESRRIESSFEIRSCSLCYAD